MQYTIWHKQTKRNEATNSNEYQKIMEEFNLIFKLIPDGCISFTGKLISLAHMLISFHLYIYIRLVDRFGWTK